MRQLFAVQNYPDLRQYPEGPPEQPYDVSGWTLPYQFDVRVVEARAPLAVDVRAAMEALSAEPLALDAAGDASPWDSPPDVGFDTNPVARAIVPPAGRVTGGGGALILDPAQNNTYKALGRAWASGGQVSFAPGHAAADSGSAGTSGRWLVTGLAGSARDGMVRDLHLRAEGGSMPSGRVAKPRIGLYRPWSASIDEGWTRWLLETYGLAPTSVRNADVLAGNLRDRYDVVVLADIRARTILEGFESGSVPPRYAGGIGQEGARELDAFVRGGGTLVTINGSSQFAVDALHLPVKDATDGLAREDFFASGAIVELLTDPSQPVMSGMPERAKVFVGGSPVFTTEKGFEGHVLAMYPKEGSPLLSGYFLGEEHVQGYAAALDVAHGDGHVVLLGMRPQWRGQPFGTFKILFNAALFTKAVADQAPDNGAFWTAPAAEKPQAADSAGANGGRGRPGGR